MLDEFDITKRWPATDPDVIQLYSRPTPNGIKVSAMLEECGLVYEAHPVSFAEKEQKSPEFLSLNPNNKIPAIIDPDGPDGQPLGLWESGTILLYLADRTGKFIPSGQGARYHAMQWIMWQVGGAGPMFGQFRYFLASAKKTESGTHPLERFAAESRRLLSILDQQLSDQQYILGAEYSIADMAIWPWVRSLTTTEGADEILGVSTLKYVDAWFGRCMERPASSAALTIPPRT